VRLLNTGTVAINPANVVHLQDDPPADRVQVHMVDGTVINVSAFSYQDLVILLNEAMRG
jgi:hypothetical protein